MMYRQQTSLRKFYLIFSNLSLGSKVMQMLDVEALVELLCLNSGLKRQLIQNSTLLNRIYLLQFIKHRDMFTYSFCFNSNYNKYFNEKVEANLQNFKTERIGNIAVMKNIRIELERNLRNIVPAEEVGRIVGDVFETMVNPSIPMPSLRKQTVGDHCNTALQILLAELNHRDSSLKLQEELYSNLKVYFIQNHQSVLHELVQNKSILINMRFQSELVNSYESTNSSFLNIINVFLVLIDYHLETIKSYLESQYELPSFQFLIEFTRRYNTFRNMVMAFEEKLGFMMELFTKAFNYLVKELEIYPGCSIWRSLMKKWVNKMKGFQGKTAEGFVQLLTKMREGNLQQTVEGGERLESLSQQIVSNYIMRKDLCSQTSPINSAEFDLICAEEPEALEAIVSMYVEYAVDVSSNEYNIHWCESSSQKLNQIYTNVHNLILASTKELYGNWKDIFGGDIIVQEVLESDVEFLRATIKPTTLKHIIQEANIVIQNEFKGKGKLIKGGFERLDDRIRYLNEKRMIPLELNEEYKEFFDFDRTIQLEKIESRIRSIGKKEHSEVVESVMKEMQVEEDDDEMGENAREMQTEQEI